MNRINEAGENPYRVKSLEEINWEFLQQVSAAALQTVPKAAPPSAEYAAEKNEQAPMAVALADEQAPMAVALADEQAPMAVAIAAEQVPMAGAIADEPAPHQKRRRIVKDIRFFAIVFCLVICILLVLQGDKSAVFGYTFEDVVSASMQAEIPQWSMVVVKETDPNAIKIGDNITYRQTEGATITHKVVAIDENHDESGARGFQTQGVSNTSPDYEIVHADAVVGVVKLHIPLIGKGLDWLRNNVVATAIFMVGLVLMLVIIRGRPKDDQEGQEAEEAPAIQDVQDAKRRIRSAA